MPLSFSVYLRDVLSELVSLPVYFLSTLSSHYFSLITYFYSHLISLIYTPNVQYWYVLKFTLVSGDVYDSWF